MRSAILLAFIVAAFPVAAQPGPPPRPAAPAASGCDVTIVRAPDDVRPVVESWIRSEPHCAATLDVRILRITGGLYLLAQAPDGRTYERIVPDAQSAGLLIASWSADDGIGHPAAAPPVSAAPAPPSRRANKWLAVGGVAEVRGGYGGAGIHGEIDLASWGRGFSFGVAAAAGRSTTDFYGSASSGTLDMHDYTAVGYIAYTLKLGRMRLRPAVGAGVVYTVANAFEEGYTGGPGTMQYLDSDGVFPVGTAAITAGFVLGPSWELSAGPVGTLLQQRYQLMGSSAGSSPELVRRDADLGFFVGLRRRL